ncbi:rRNA maturation RNase YbeY [Candidatus Gracilibacteria bacterium]|nr:rRNA maturation RNase YbeY [Candidatus Gracilibacteria bacterium]
MFRFQIIQGPVFKVDENIIDNIFKNVSKYINKTQNGIINIVCVPPEEIQTLNSKYRSKDTPTDVLSFHYFEDFGQLQEHDTAGEVILCEEILIQNTQEYGVSNQQEFYKLIIHSLLHILGYDHEEEQDYIKMQEKEHQIWQEVFEK